MNLKSDYSVKKCRYIYLVITVVKKRLETFWMTVINKRLKLMLEFNVSITYDLEHAVEKTCSLIMLNHKIK